MDFLSNVAGIAYEWHQGQVRKHSGLPYFVHPVQVAALVERAWHQDPRWSGWQPNGQVIIAAAFLHDVIEDCGVNLQDFEAEFGTYGGEDLYNLVMEVTEVSKHEDGNRATRRAMDAAHYSQASPGMATVKLADMIDNAIGIRRDDVKFWKSAYKREMTELLPMLRHGHPSLWQRANEVLGSPYPLVTLKGNAA